MLNPNLPEGIIRELLNLGFTQTEIPSKFYGFLTSPQGEIGIDFYIVDLDFVHAPLISIHSEFHHLFHSGIPHVHGDEQWLCYLEREEVRLDSFDPITVIRQCLFRAEMVISELLCEDSSKEVDREILTHWSPSRNNYLVSPIGDKSLHASIEKKFEGMDARCLIGTLPDIDKQCLAWGRENKERSTFPAFCINLPTGISSNTSNYWPVSNWGDLLECLRYIDSAIHDNFLNWCSYKKHRNLNRGFLFKSPGGGWGGILLPKNIETFKKTALISRKNYLKKIKRDRHFFDVIPLSFQDATDEFIYSRNNHKENNLYRKRILLIGAGTVGGYLARQLVQLGGGLGNGYIDIYDSDSLSTGNLGRHYLHRKFLGVNKAQAVTEKLKEEFFNVSINAIPQHWDGGDGNKELSNYDLVIDATGFDAISAKLNRKSLFQGRLVPILHIWIEGTGDTAIAFWNSSCGACHRCLHHDTRGTGAYNTSHTRRYFRCGESYLPYLSSSSEVAAALATQMVHQHINGTSKYNLAYIHLSKKMGAKAKYVPSAAECELCQI